MINILKFLFLFSFFILLSFEHLYSQTEARAVFLPNSHILVCGGKNANSSYDNDCYLDYSDEYAVSISSDIYRYYDMLSTPRYAHTMTLLPDGRVLVAGGYDGLNPTNTADIIIFNNFNIVNSTSRITVTMSSPRAYHTATLIGKGPDAGNVLICGGTDGSNTLDTCEIFITSATSAPYFKSGPKMTSKREGHTANLLPNGKIFIAGGYERPNLYHLTTDMYDPLTNTITPQASLEVGRAYHTAVTLQSGYTLIIGGKNSNTSQKDVFSRDNSDVQDAQRQYTNGYIDVVEMFDQNGARSSIGINQVNTGSYDYGVSELFPYRMAYHSASLLQDGSIMIYGGRGNIPVTYVSPNVVAAKGSYITLSNPEVPVPDDVRKIYITGDNVNVYIKNIRLSRYVIGNLIEADWFIPPKEDDSPSAQFSNTVIYLEKTTATLDGVFVGGDKKRGYGWLEETQVPLHIAGSNSYVLFYPVDIISNESSFNAWLRISGASLSSGTATNLLNTTTATINLSFKFPEEYWGTNIIGATVTIVDASYSDSQVKLTITGGVGVITGASVGSKGDVSVSVNFTNIEGLVENTTDHALNFPRTAQGTFPSISYKMSFTTDRINFYEDKSFSVNPSTIVVRDAVFSNLSRYYPISSQIYLNDRKITGVSFDPNFNHFSFVSRSGSIYIGGGETCDICIRPPATTWIYYDAGAVGLSFYYDKEWDAISKMKSKRAFHTLTALNDGTILACGGTDGQKTLDTCEAFNERFGNEWVIVATMTVPRAYHTATVLPNGTVLLAGGTSGRTKGSPALSDAEIFYPDIRKTVKTSSFKRARLLHTATLLPDGNVLFVGGVSSSTYLDSAEIFISTANMFVELSSKLNTPRSEHAATLLPNGKVLITGGVNGVNDALSSCEIFDVQTKAFSSTDPMPQPRKAHTATLLDSGIVMVFGGSNQNEVLNKVLTYNDSMSSGQKWNYYPFIFLKPEDEEDNENNVYVGRANHKAVLLPDRTVVYVGGESIYPREVVRSVNERLVADSGHLSYHGRDKRRIGTGVVLTRNNYIVAAGGFDGNGNYLDDVEGIYYSISRPDQESLSSLIPRKPFISSATYTVDTGENLVIYSSYSNINAIVEASGGGASSRNSDFSKPFIILTSLNGDYTVNLSTMLYVTSYNPSWEITYSTIVVKIPDRNLAPYGWYYLHVCLEGVCSDPYIIQISTPRPKCTISQPTAVPGSVGISSMSWRWNLQNIDPATVANGFAVFSSSDVFISTVPFPVPQTAITTFTLTGLMPNTPSSLKIGCYNIGGFSDKNSWAVAISTIHTLAKPPKNLEITYASFDTVELKWDGNGNNPGYTPYQIEVSTDKLFNSYSIAINFANNYTNTKATIKNLEPNWRYYFRVKARNGDGFDTVYDYQNNESSTWNNPVSTITVGNIVGLSGIPLSTSSIKWMWNPAGGADGYEIYDYKITEDPNDPVFKSTIDVSVLIATTPYNYYTWSGLNSNMPYQVKVRSFKIDTFNGSTNTVYGPFAVSPVIHTLSAEPRPAYPNVFTEVTTGSFKVTWDSNGNSTSTVYRLDISLDENFSDYKSFEAYTDSIIFPFVSYSVGGLLPNTRYYARVYSINKDGIMTPTPAELGSKYTLAQPPPWVWVSSVSVRGVKLNWDIGDNPSYTVYQVRYTSVSFESPYVSTPVTFGMGYTDNSYFITGLWIKTTYYFDVTARNMEGIETLSMQTATPAYIVAGISGVPTGSMGGLIIPSEDNVIKGTLSDNRSVTLTFYKGTFSTPQQFAIASLTPSQLFSMVGSSNPCGYSFGGSTIAFGIYSNEQPVLPVKFTFNYFSNESYGADGISTNKTKVTLARYNPQTGQCLPVKTEINTEVSGSGIGGEITAYLNHFSIYQLIILNPATSLSGVKVFPNPFYPNRAGQGHITIIDLPSDSSLTFYTLSGVKVYQTKADLTGTAYWDGRNSKGQPVGSGVYLCVIKSKYGQKTIKVAIER